MLEYPQVVEKLASYASFSLSDRLARSLTPYSDPSVIRYKLASTTATEQKPYTMRELLATTMQNLRIESIVIAEEEPENDA